MLQPGRSAPANASLAGGYRYGYNGKEKDNNDELGLTTYDYGLRIYNSGLGRFLSVDPLTKEYPWYTPFQFAGNSPIWAVDLDGGEEKVTTASAGHVTTATLATATSRELVVQTAKRAVVQRVVNSSGNLAWEFFGVSAGITLRIAGLTAGFVLAPRTAGDGTLTKGDPQFRQKQHEIHKADESEYQRLTEEKASGHPNSVDESKLQNLIARGLGQSNPINSPPLKKGYLRTDDLVKWEVKEGDAAAEKIGRYMDMLEVNGVEKMPPTVVFTYKDVNYVMDGHHRLAAAEQLGIEIIPVR